MTLPAAIITRIADQHGLTPDDLRGRRRTMALCRARLDAMIVLSLLGYSSGQTARWLGREASTVRHLLRRAGA